MTRRVDGLVHDIGDVRVLLGILARLGRPHADEITPRDFARVFGPDAQHVVDELVGFHLASETDRAAAGPAMPVGNDRNHERGQCVIAGGDAIDSATAGELLDRCPRRVLQLIDGHDICAVQPRPRARHRISRASVLELVARGFE